jgi:AmmeMemoRadiSam system protein B/AmmeMemoRadiSam system protein A
METFSFNFRILCVAFTLAVFWCESAVADDIRKPVVAGLWYPGNRQQLEQVIEHLTAQAQQTRVNIPVDKSLKALILPHAGYVYSGLTAAHASLVLNKKQYRKIILLGPDHRAGFSNGAISDVKAYQTPLGLVGLHADAARLRLNAALFRSSPTSDRSEHSLEAIVPFLQFYLEEFEIVPIVFGPSNIDQMVTAIDPLLDEDTLLVISSDLSHFLPYSDAVAKDRETINMILAHKSKNLINQNDRACGRIPILVLLRLARRHQWDAVLLHYSNSGDTAGGKDRVVGYAAIAFYGKADVSGSTSVNPHTFTEKQGQDLVKLARRTIMNRLGIKIDSPILSNDLKNPCYQKRCGTFVTLKKDGQLRGCIGNLSPNDSVLEGVKQNAVNAAFHDPRFPPLRPYELEKIRISVSILTEPQPLEYKQISELLSRLRVHEDGVIIRKANAGATFLPQVWEQLPKPEKFLTQLCLKAGLPPDAWQKSKLEVWTYQVQYFEEQK